MRESDRVSVPVWLGVLTPLGVCEAVLESVCVMLGVPDSVDEKDGVPEADSDCVEVHEGVREADGDALDVRDSVCVRLRLRDRLGDCEAVVEAVLDMDAESVPV